jgi:hypothetical protein
MKALLIALSCVAALSLLPVSTVAAKEGQVVVLSKKSVPEMREYTADVDRRLQKGRYDVLDSKDRAWLGQRIGELNERLAATSDSSPDQELLMLFSEFETKIIEAEEGDIVCRMERPTGSRMNKQVCRSKKKMEEDRLKGQDSLRGMKRPQTLIKDNT